MKNEEGSPVKFSNYIELVYQTHRARFANQTNQVSLLHQICELSKL